MAAVLKAVPVTADFPDADGLQSIMDAQFPLMERYPIAQLQRVAEAEGLRFVAFYDGPTLVGFYCDRLTDEFCYAIYVAVAPALTGRGYGSAILGTMFGEAGKDRVFYCYVETPDDGAANAEQRRRRIRLYERFGLRLEDHRVLMTGLSHQLMSTAHRFPAERAARGLEFVRQIDEMQHNAILEALEDGLRCVPVTEDFKDLDGLQRIMSVQFPPDEGYAVDKLLAAARECQLQFNAWYAGDRLAAFYCHHVGAECAFGIFVAIAPEFAGQRIGLRLFARELEIHRDKIYYIYVESPDDAAPDSEFRRKRIAHYEHVGMRLEDREVLFGKRSHRLMSNAHLFSEDRRRRGEAYVAEMTKLQMSAPD